MSNGGKSVRRFATATLAFLAFLGGLWWITSGVFSTPVAAVAGVNEQINFQGRLFNAQGAVVPDGYYNIQFKIYQDGDGQSAGNTTGSPAGSLKWTESWLNVNGKGIQVKNGYMSANLGSVTPFGSSIDWNQDTLWLSMNIGSTNASCASFATCTPDGEMLPMKRLSSTPYALNAGKLGGLTSAGFIQNQNAAAQSTTNFWIDGTGRAGTLQAATSINTPAIRSLTDSTSAIQIQNAAGSSTVMNIDTSNGRIGIGSGAAPSATLQVSGTLTSSGGAISLNDSSNFGVSIGGGTSTGAITIGNAANTTTLGSDTLNIGSATTATSIIKTAQTTANTAGTGLTIRGATGNGTGAGGIVTIQGGTAGLTNANGGNVVLKGGTGNGSGVNGLVLISNAAYSTASVQSSATNVNVTQANIDSFGTIVLSAQAAGVNFTLGSPTLGAAAAGKVIYVTAANGSPDFTLRANVGGGTGVEQNIAMRQNTTATMIWNGGQWTAAGASSSTTLQSAYDNTLQSAGGAELVVSKTSSTNGLTIRDSSTNSVNGTLLSVQTSSAAGLLSVNSNVTEYASNAGAETAGGTSTTFPSNTWSAITTAPTTTVSRYVTAGNNIATGQGSVSVVTGAAANAGVKNQIVNNTTGSPAALNANTTYNVSFAARLSSGTFTDMNVYYSVDGSAASVPCTTAATAATSVWTKINCTFTTPTSGIINTNAILIRQTAATARTFYVDNLSVTIAADYNFATDSSVSDNVNFATNWTSAGLGTVNVTRNTTDGNDASDSAQADITAGAANAGLRNRLSSTPLPNTLYRVTVYAKATSAFSDFKVRYSRDNGTNFIDCVDYNTQTVSTVEWTKITCYIQTDATAATSPYVYFVETSSAVRTYMVDSFSMTLRTATTPNVQIGGGVNGGPTTLLTLDKGASAPIASDNDALLGSMYYDTTLGKLQCYEADGWGACGSSPDNIVTISPEYTNAVMHGTGIGTMTSDLCSDTLDINDGTSGQATICGTNETYNYYKWTSPQPTSQTYSIYVSYQLPNTFKSFTSGSTSLMGRTDSANSSVSYQIYRNDASGLTTCGPTVAVSTGAQSTWQVGKATGAADPSTCAFSPGNSIVVKITVAANSNANAYVGNLGFTFNNR